MARYEVMSEGANGDDVKDFMPAIAWAYRPGEKVTLAALPGCEQLAEPYQEKLDQARAQGFSEEDIWRYWTAQGGNAYFSLRTLPEPVEAPDIHTALNKALRRM